MRGIMPLSNSNQKTPKL